MSQPTKPDELETPDEKRARTRSHIVCYISIFLYSVGFSITQSAIWPYLKEIDSNVTKTSLGWVIMINPLGQIIFGTIVGHWSNKIKSIRIPTVVCLTLYVLSYLLYATLYAYEGRDDNLGYSMMLISRFLVGMSAGTFTLVRSYVGSSTTVKERVSKIATLYACQALGFMLGPGIQALLTVVVPTRLDSAIPGIVWNQYTAVGWLMAAVGLLNMTMFLPRYFKEIYIARKEYNLAQDKKAGNVIEDLRPNYFGAICVSIVFGCLLLVPSISETLATPMVTDLYGISDDEALFYVSIVLSLVSLIGIIIMLVVTKLTKRFDDRKVFIFLGYIPLVLSIVLHYPIGNKPIAIANCTSEYSNISNRFSATNNYDLSFIANTNRFSDLGYEDHSSYVANVNVTEGCYGCPYESQPWCLTAPQITPPQLLVAFIFTRCSFVIGMSVSQAIYTKILGPKPLGLWMSLLSTTSSLCRIISPIWMSHVYVSLGLNYVYLIVLILESSALLILILAYKQIAPMKLRNVSNLSGDENKLKIIDET